MDLEEVEVGLKSQGRTFSFIHYSGIFILPVHS